MSYRSLAVLGVASIQGLSVASFEKDDAQRLLFFCGKQISDTSDQDALLSQIPHWLTPPLPSRKRSEPCRENKVLFRMSQVETLMFFVCLRARFVDMNSNLSEVLWPFSWNVYICKKKLYLTDCILLTKK